MRKLWKELRLGVHQASREFGANPEEMAILVVLQLLNLSQLPYLIRICLILIEFDRLCCS